MARTAPRRRRLLVPLATLVAASAVAVGSGATFTSTSFNPGNRYETGTLTQTNDRDNTWIFDKGNLKPGDAVIGNVTITNSGTLPATYQVTESAVTSTFQTATNLTISIDDVTSGTAVNVFAGTFGTVGAVDLGLFGAGEARKYTFTVTLAQTAGNGEQGKKATAAYTWDGVQTAATTYVQTGGTTTPAG